MQLKTQERDDFKAGKLDVKELEKKKAVIDRPHPSLSNVPVVEAKREKKRKPNPLDAEDKRTESEIQKIKCFGESPESEEYYSHYFNSDKVYDFADQLHLGDFLHKVKDDIGD